MLCSGRNEMFALEYTYMTLKHNSDNLNLYNYKALHMM